MSDIIVNYNSEDFFYVRAGSKAPSDTSCNLQFKIIPDTSCNHFPTLSNQYKLEVETCTTKAGNRSGADLDAYIRTCLSLVDASNIDRTTYGEDYTQWRIWQDNSFNCYRKEICLNRDNAAEITKLNNDHLGSEANSANSLRSYNNELWKTGNLSVGIILLAILIYYTR